MSYMLILVERVPYLMRRKYQRRLRKKDIVKHRIIFASIFFCLAFVLATGYSAFSTNINLSAKGNLYKVSDKCYGTSDNGNGTVTITDYDKSCGTEVNIPSTIKGLTVTKIGDNAFQNKGITKLTLPDTLVEVGNYAFHSNKLESLTLPTNIKEVGKYAFEYNEIKYLKLNEGLKNIGLDAFNGNNLTEINIPSSVTYMEGGAFGNNNLKGDAAFIYGINSDGSTNYSVLNSYAGRNATGTSIPDTITVIQPEAYVNVKYEEITIPGRIKEIPSYCFAYSMARKVTIEEGVETLNNMSLAGETITSIDLPSTVKTIHQSTFKDNENLTMINVNRTEGAIEGTPWGATNATLNWTGTN